MNVYVVVPMGIREKGPIAVCSTLDKAIGACHAAHVTYDTDGYHQFEVLEIPLDEVSLAEMCSAGETVGTYRRDNPQPKGYADRRAPMGEWRPGERYGLVPLPQKADITSD